ncbi:MAG: FtsX-like permease family protein, partial [Euryarchaeota archaeon]|nr:FtsX-like permease family protein [Euryarchaeota archaeon]
VALLVAGFGIMNTMLMSVLERTREIGVLKSMGAKRRHILEIFLAEAGIMGFAGGVAGAAVGIGVAKLGNLLIGMALAETLRLDGTARVSALLSTPPWLILFAIAFSVLVSAAFGLYPAWRASTLHPVEALRQP